MGVGIGRREGCSRRGGTAAQVVLHASWALGVLTWQSVGHAQLGTSPPTQPAAEEAAEEVVENTSQAAAVLEEAAPDEEPALLSAPVTLPAPQPAAMPTVRTPLQPIAPAPVDTGPSRPVRRDTLGDLTVLTNVASVVSWSEDGAPGRISPPAAVAMDVVSEPVSMVEASYTTRSVVHSDLARVPTLERVASLDLPQRSPSAVGWLFRSLMVLTCVVGGLMALLLFRGSQERNPGN